MDLDPGTVVDRYTVQNVLGEGGMAVVYRVKHNQLGTYHALKVLSLNSRSIRDRMLQEGRVQASLGHPNIVAVSDVIDVQGQPGLVMEYIRGPALDQLLQQQRLTLDQSSALASDIITAVAYAHDKGLVHRDLKPANILLAITDVGIVPKITDFGLAKVVSEGASSGKTRTGATMGTPHYMAPGQIRDAKNVGPEADVFSLGAILYELVCGRRAFDGDDLYEIFKSINEERYVPPRQWAPDLPVAMEQAIVGALKADKAERIPDCHTLLAVWKGEIALGTAAPASPISRPEGPWSGDILASVSSLSSSEDHPDVPSKPSRASEQTFALDGAGAAVALSDDAQSSSSVAADADGSLAPATSHDSLAESPATNGSPTLAPPSLPPTTAPQSTTAGTLGRVGMVAGLLAAGGGLGIFALAVVVVVAMAGGAWLVVGGADATHTVQVVHVPTGEGDGGGEVDAASGVAAGIDPKNGTPMTQPQTSAVRPATGAGAGETAGTAEPAESPEEPTRVGGSDATDPDDDPEGTEDGAEDGDPTADDPQTDHDPSMQGRPAGGKTAALPRFVAPPAPFPVKGKLPRDLDPSINSDIEVRAAAVAARQDSPGDLETLFRVAMTDPSTEIAERAVKAIRNRFRSGVGDRGQTAAALAHLSFKGPREVRDVPVLALGTHGDDLGVLTVHLSNPDRGMRITAVKALGIYARMHPEQVGNVDRSLAAASEKEDDKRVLRAIALARQVL